MFDDPPLDPADDLLLVLSGRLAAQQQVLIALVAGHLQGRTEDERRLALNTLCALPQDLPEAAWADMPAEARYARQHRAAALEQIADQVQRVLAQS